MINYWRSVAKAEVDFVLRVSNEIIPVEAKYQGFKTPKISRSLRSFIKSYNPNRTLIVTKDFWKQTEVNDTIILFTPAYYL
jgi:predicted AAA+ superfamily ATPase